jgi:hypothetical protein
MVGSYTTVSVSPNTPRTPSMSAYVFVIMEATALNERNTGLTALKIQLDSGSGPVTIASLPPTSYGLLAGLFSFIVPTGAAYQLTSLGGAGEIAIIATNEYIIP